MKIKAKVEVPYTVWHTIELEVDVDMDAVFDVDMNDVFDEVLYDAVQDAKLPEVPYDSAYGVAAPHGTRLTLGMDAQREREITSHDYVRPTVFSQGDEDGTE